MSVLNLALLITVFSPTLPPPTDAAEALTTFRRSIKAKAAPERIRALEELMKAQRELKTPNARITKAIGKSLADDDLTVQRAAAGSLAAHQPAKDAVEVLAKGLQEASKALAGHAMNHPDHAASMAFVVQTIESMASYRTEKAQKGLLKFLSSNQQILHGEAVPAIVAALASYETHAALDALLDYQETAEGYSFGHLAGRALHDRLVAMSEAREIGEHPPFDVNDLARPWKKWLKTNGRLFSKKVKAKV